MLQAEDGGLRRGFRVGAVSSLLFGAGLLGGFLVDDFLFREPKLVPLAPSLSAEEVEEVVRQALADYRPPSTLHADVDRSDAGALSDLRQLTQRLESLIDKMASNLSTLSAGTEPRPDVAASRDFWMRIAGQKSNYEALESLAGMAVRERRQRYVGITPAELFNALGAPVDFIEKNGCGIWVYRNSHADRTYYFAFQGGRVVRLGL